MLPALVFSDRLWAALAYLPFALAFLSGIAVAVACFGQRGWEPRCRRCGQDLRGANEGTTTCPECGADLAKRGAVRPGRRRLRPRWVGAALLLVGLTVATLPKMWITPSVLRTYVAAFVDFDDVLVEAGKSNTTFSRQTLQARLKNADSAMADEIVARAAQDIGTTGAMSNSFNGSLDTLRKAKLLTSAHHLKLADSVVAALRGGKLAR